MLRVSAPGSVTAMPSAIVGPPVAAGAWPSACSIPAYPSACTPMIRTAGRSAFTATAIPAIESAAADRHDDRVDGSASVCARSSRPMVPWPAMIARVVERGHERRAELVRDPLRARERARVVGAFEHHLRAVVRGVRRPS